MPSTTVIDTSRVRAVYERFASLGRAKGEARAVPIGPASPAFWMDNGVVVLAMVYGKGEQADLTMVQRRDIATALRVISEQLKGELR
jgi:hypothetical protein